MRDRRQLETIAGRVNADGTVAVGDGFTCVRTGVGAYTLTFPVGFRLLSIAGNNSAGNNYIVLFAFFTERTVNVNGNVGNTAAAIDTPFSFIAVGVQA